MTSAGRLPPLESLRIFEACVRHGSFVAAAQELHLTASAVSHRIAALEEQLGAAVFERHGRRVAPTAAGKDYAAAIGAALAMLREATRRFGAHRADGPLTISVAPLFAMRWLLPRLGRFEAAHPGVPVRIASTVKTTNFAEDDTDAVIRFGRGPWPGLESHFMFAMDMVPVCAPATAAGPPPLRAPADLAAATLLHAETMPEVWRMWLTVAGLKELDAGGGRRLQDSAMTIEAAAAGLGVAMADRRFVEADLASGRLVIPFDLPLHTQSGYHFAYPPARSDDPRIAAFRAWLLAEAQRSGPSEEV